MKHLIIVLLIALFTLGPIWIYWKICENAFGLNEKDKKPVTQDIKEKI